MKTIDGWICPTGDILSTPGLNGKDTVIGRIMVPPKISMCRSLEPVTVFLYMAKGN